MDVPVPMGLLLDSVNRPVPFGIASDLLAPDAVD
jgi:hypothetical protein